MLELKDERMMRLEQILANVNWLKHEYEPRMESVRKGRAKIFSDLYQVREMMSKNRAKRKK